MPATSFHPGPDKLFAEGPRLSVAVSAPSRWLALLARTGQPIPNPEGGWALVDTGATLSAVDAQIATRLNLPVISAARVLTAAGPATQPVYAVALALGTSPAQVLEPVFATGTDLQAHGLVALIGRDILRRLMLLYDGRLGYWAVGW